MSIAVVDEDHGPVAAAFKTRTRRARRGRRVVAATTPRASSAIRTAARLAVVFPPDLSDNYRRGRPSDVQLLTDPAQETDLRAAKMLLLLMEKKAGSATDPLAASSSSSQSRT